MVSQKQEIMRFEFDLLDRVILRQQHNNRPIRRVSMRLKKWLNEQIFESLL